MSRPMSTCRLLLASRGGLTAPRGVTLNSGRYAQGTTLKNLNEGGFL
jgi:hypothetical protein